MLHKIKLDEVLLHHEPQPCLHCQQPTYFALIEPFIVRPVCPSQLVPLLRKGSYPKLLMRLYETLYYAEGNRLYEPQRDIHQALPDEEKWEIGRAIHGAAHAYAQAAVEVMSCTESMSQPV